MIFKEILKFIVLLKCWGFNERKKLLNRIIFKKKYEIPLLLKEKQRGLFTKRLEKWKIFIKKYKFQASLK